MRFFYCIKTSKQEFITIISTLLAAVSLCGINWEELGILQKFFIKAGLAFAILLILYSIVRIFHGKHIFKYGKDEEKIKKYMHDIYFHSGSLVICTTGQLDWVNNEIKTELQSKAKNKHLIIFSSTRNALLNDLEKSGAIIYDKNMLGITPCSNTSVLNVNAGDVLIATGYSNKKYHIIDEYTSKSSITDVIKDLVNIIEKLINQNKILRSKLSNKSGQI